MAMNAPLALAEVATITSGLIDGFAIDVARRCLDAAPYAARDREHNNAVVPSELLRDG